MQFTGTVTRKSNGSIEFLPTDATAFGKLPAMGDEVTLDVEITRTAAEVEKATKAEKAARAVPGESEPVQAAKKK
jgi:hypothetical protein